MAKARRTTHRSRAGKKLYAVRDKSGRDHVLLITVKQVSIGRGISLYSCWDITERKRAEEALRESELWMRGIFNSLEEAVLVVTPDRIVADVNPAAQRMFGYSKEDLKSLSTKELHVDEDHYLEFGDRIDGAFDRNEPANFEFVARRKNGDVFPTEHTVSLLDNEAGEAVGIVSVIRDITERKQKEEELVRQAAVLQAINEVFRETLTCETEEELGKNCLAVAERLTESKFGYFAELNAEGLLDSIAISNPGWDACEMAVADARALIKNMPVRGIDRMTVRDGKSRIVNGDAMATHPDRCGTPEGHPAVTAFLGVPLKQGEETIGMIGLGNKEGGYTLADQEAVEHLAAAFLEALRSVRAERRLDQMQDQLAHVGRVSTLGEMVAGIAHEVGQPLYSIRNFAQASANVLAAEGEADLKDLRDWNTSISKAASHAGEIVRRLREFVQRTKVKRSLHGVDELIEEALQLVAFQIQRHRATVRLELSDISPVVHVDQVEIQQVLVNLLQNAYEAMDDADAELREITVRTELDGKFVEVSVTDSGPGLPSEEGLQLFDAFVTTKRDGLGIGLTIATTIVEDHGGKLWVTSQPGEGSSSGGATFHFTLPVSRAPAAKEGEEIDDR